MKSTIDESKKNVWTFIGKNKADEILNLRFYKEGEENNRQQDEMKVTNGVNVERETVHKMA